MPTIVHITGRQILDSRGHPTVEATVLLDNGLSASSSVASGSITNNELEGIELRDQDPTRYFGLGVSKAIEAINGEINQALIGQDPLYQTRIDQMLVNLDGTKNKARLGANSLLAVSQAVMKVAAASLQLPLFVYIKEKYQLITAYRIPTPIFNIINGGQHGGGTLDFQEFQLVPASHLPYSQALQIGVETFLAVEENLSQKGAITSVGLEGGFSPNLANNNDALQILEEATKKAGYTLSKEAFLGIDVAPKHFYKNHKFTIKDKTQPMNSKEFIKYLKQIHEQFRVFTYEDPLPAESWSDWKDITLEIGQTAMIVADDLILTNKTLLMKAIEEKACNAVVIKPNRAGTVTEAIEVANLAKQAGWHTVMSHRSSETTDDFLADLAVGIGTDYVKFGAPSRGERVVKYNRLIRIEEILLASNAPTATAPPTPQASAQVDQATPSQPIQTTERSPMTPQNPPAADPAAYNQPSMSDQVQPSPAAAAPEPSASFASAPAVAIASTPVPGNYQSSVALSTTDSTPAATPVPEPALAPTQPALQPTPVPAPAVTDQVSATPSEPIPAYPNTAAPAEPAAPTLATPTMASPEPTEVAPIEPAATPALAPTPGLNPAPANVEPVLTIPEIQPRPVTQPEAQSALQPAAEPVEIQESLDELAQMVGGSNPGPTPVGGGLPKPTLPVMPEENSTT